jgi:hypothetical protein
LAAATALSCAAPQAPRTVDIVARSYAFGVPPTLPAGPAVFRLINEAAVSHEVQLYRFKAGVTPEAARKMMAADSVPDAAADAWGSVLIAGPHDTTSERILVDLKSGEMYALVCEFRDGPGKPKHALLGMFALLQVP